MNTVVFSKNSWHYKLFNHYKSEWDWQEPDICRYIRVVLYGLFMMSLLTIISTIIGSIVADALYWDFRWLVFKTPFSMQHDVAIVGNLIMVGLVIILGISTLSVYFENRFKAELVAPVKPPSFLTVAYRRFKEKVCYLVEFK